MSNAAEYVGPIILWGQGSSANVTMCVTQGEADLYLDESSGEQQHRFDAS